MVGELVVGVCWSGSNIGILPKSQAKIYCQQNNIWGPTVGHWLSIANISKYERNIWEGKKNRNMKNNNHNKMLTKWIGAVTSSEDFAMNISAMTDRINGKSAELGSCMHQLHNPHTTTAQHTVRPHYLRWLTARSNRIQCTKQTI